jgi:hypothetical protein
VPEIDLKPARRHVSYDKNGRMKIKAPTFSPGEWIWIAMAWGLFVLIPLMVVWLAG